MQEYSWVYMFLKFVLAVVAAVSFVVSINDMRSRARSLTKLSPTVALLSAHVVLYYVVTEYASRVLNLYDPSCECVHAFSSWSIALYLHSGAALLYIIVFAIIDKSLFTNRLKIIFKES